MIANKEKTLTAAPSVSSTASIKIMVPASNNQSRSPDEVNRLLQSLLDRQRNKHFSERILKQVMACIPALESNRAYTLRQICGEEFWEQLDDGEAREAGEWIALVVALKLLHLRFGGKNSSNHHTYYLI
jgi:hypothetical protein